MLPARAFPGSRSWEGDRGVEVVLVAFSCCFSGKSFSGGSVGTDMSGCFLFLKSGYNLQCLCINQYRQPFGAGNVGQAFADDLLPAIFRPRGRLAHNTITIQDKVHDLRV